MLREKTESHKMFNCNQKGKKKGKIEKETKNIYNEQKIVKNTILIKLYK